MNQREKLFKKYRLLDGCKKMILEQDKEFIKNVNIYLCSKLEGELLLKKKDLEEIYAGLNRLARNL